MVAKRSAAAKPLGKKAAAAKLVGKKAAAAKPAPRSPTAPPIPRRSPSRSPTPRARKKRDTCFVISPFGGWYDRYFDEIYSPAVKAAGLDPLRADDLYLSSAIVQDIWNSVQSSRVMIADLTAKNPNVLYELGLAHAVGKPAILLTQDMEDVPYDLRSLRVINYSVDDPAWSDLLRKSITQALKEALADPQDAVLAPFLHQNVEKQPSVNPQEKRLLQLEAAVRGLRAEVQNPPRLPRPVTSRIDLREARDLIQSLLRRDSPPAEIVYRLQRMGVPRSFVLRELDRLDQSQLQPQADT